MKSKGILYGCVSLFLTLPIMASAAPEDTMNATTATATANQGNLTVRITGVKNNDGVIRIAIFNDANAFQDKTDGAPKAYQKAQLPITNGQAQWQLTNLPYGEYAIKLFHDEDNSGKLKKSFVGRPSEGVGFSNNPKLDGHAPKYDEAKFTVNQPQTDINVEMINPK